MRPSGSTRRTGDTTGGGVEKVAGSKDELRQVGGQSREGASYPTRESVPFMEFINKFSNSTTATLPLPLFKILPLPFPYTSSAELDRPAKINKPIVK